VTEEAEFDAFARDLEPKLWRALVPVVGPTSASDGAAEALLYAWLHWDRVRNVNNPAGYLYRVARRLATKVDGRRRPIELPSPMAGELPGFEPGLVPALQALTEMQRTVVWLVEGCGWTLVQTADVLDVSVSTVRNHQTRGMKRLRVALKVNTDA
jgi:RNA polymerase sigma-70 factor (ECF subfamily)